MNSKEEKWFDVKGYEGLYQVSNFGRVKSCQRKVNRLGHLKTINERILKNVLDRSTGYYCVGISKNGKGKKIAVHRLVAEAFLPNPTNLPFINHKDEIRTNNNVENLEWCTIQYNNTYGTIIEKLRNSKGTTILQYDLQGNFIKKWNSSMAIQRELNISQSNIIKCCNNKRNHSGGYVWKYE